MIVSIFTHHGKYFSINSNYVVIVKSKNDVILCNNSRRS
jgi:hypothetical protein